MVLLKKSKKASELNNEIILYLIAIPVIFLIVFLSSHQMTVSEDNLSKMAPDLIYQYPSLFVKSFLMLEVKDSNKQKLNLDFNKTYYIQDLIYLGDSNSKDVVEFMKRDFISDMESIDSLKSFKIFANVDFTKDELLVIKYDCLSEPKNEFEFPTQNYAYYFKGKDGKTRIIYFKSSISSQNQGVC